MTKEEILEYIKHTPANSNIAVLSDMLDDYGGSSEGESGDFSTATLTFINSEPNTTYYIYGIPQIISNKGLLVDTVPVINEAPTTIEVPLYKGNLILSNETIQNLGNSVMPTMTEGISIDSSGLYLEITGNGTFTAAGRPYIPDDSV